MCRLLRLCIALFLLLPCSVTGQELFPMTEAATNTPSKGVWGIRLFGETFTEINRQRNLVALKIMYGLTSRLSIYATPNVSNHHNTELPPDFPQHNTPQIGVSHPYLFNGVDFYAKYGIYQDDWQNGHFRVAAYAEYSLLNTAHDEAEPTLLDDTKGFGAGVITTYLEHHFAVSFTGGMILPSVYRGTIPDQFAGLPGVPAIINYSNAYNYSLSFGYLLMPDKYKNYDETNWNIYLEFLGKSYGAAQMQVANILSPSQFYYVYAPYNTALQAGQYVEVYPGVQCIVRSDLRIDFSVGYPIIGKSYVHFYPVYNIAVQRYLYSGHKKKKTM